MPKVNAIDIRAIFELHAGHTMEGVKQKNYGFESLRKKRAAEDEEGYYWPGARIKAEASPDGDEVEDEDE